MSEMTETHPRETSLGVDPASQEPATERPNHPERRSLGLVAVTLLVVAAALLRGIDFPRAYDLRDVDEIAYISGGLHLLEGILPEFRYTPAGPQTWVIWAYAGIRSVEQLIYPAADVAAAALPVRPYSAINAALFNAYRDLSIARWVWIIAAWPFVIWAVVSGYNLGRWRGGIAGGVLVGGLVAFTPIILQMSGEARPYAMAWSLAIIALDQALVPRDKSRTTAAAIFFGLAVASRIEMLLLIPFFWSAIWHQRGRDGLIYPLIRFHGIALVAGLLAAPWLLTNIVGNLRAVATVAIAPSITGPTTLPAMLKDLFWTQGIGIAMLLTLASILVPTNGRRVPRLLIGIYTLLVIASVFKSTGYGMRHHGAALLVMVLFSAGIVGWIGRRNSAVMWGIVVLALSIPLGQAIAGVVHRSRNYMPEGAAAWIEANVPPGTRIYFEHSLHDPLPTREASDAMWKEVNDHTAWQRKFESGLSRFNLSAAEIPRALSDEHMLVERGNRRGLFILGSRPQFGPRYDLRVMWSSPIFGVRDVADAFRQTGGIVIYHGKPVHDNADMNAQIEQVRAMAGESVASFVSPGGKGVWIYASPDLKARLQETPATQPAPATTQTTE